MERHSYNTVVMMFCSIVQFENCAVFEEKLPS